VSTLNAIVDEDREISAIDIFRIRGGVPELALTTRHPDEPRADLDEAQLRQLGGNHSVTRILGGEGESGRMRVAVPLSHDGSVTGVAQAALSLAEAARLKRRLRLIHAAVLAVSVAAISLALALFLERRVNRPVNTLVAGMRKAEEGALDVRVALDRG